MLRNSMSILIVNVLLTLVICRYVTKTKVFIFKNNFRRVLNICIMGMYQYVLSEMFTVSMYFGIKFGD
jgi:hypothetical protein